MTTGLLRRGEQFGVHIHALESELFDDLVVKLRTAGITLVPEANQPSDTVILAAAGTVDEAIEVYDAAPRPALSPQAGSRLLLVIADTFSRAGTLRAVEAGARVMLRSDQTDPSQLTAAVRAASHGDCRMPHDALLRILGPAGPATVAQEATDAPAAVLTTRQTMVLALMAEGFANAAISKTLSVSEHTVKNTVYDLMGRLQVHSRAHAVAVGVRTGLI